MVIFGIVGWKNSGKTTLVENIIKTLTQRGYRVSSIKHAHHQLDLDEPGRDSYRHRQAGAQETLLATHQRWVLMHEYANDLALDHTPNHTPYDQQQQDHIDTLANQLSPVDIIIVEGYKQGAHAKLEVFRNHHEDGLVADHYPNVVAIAADDPQLTTALPLLDINDTAAICDWIIGFTGLTQATSEPTQVSTGKASTALSNDCFSPNQGLASASEVWNVMRALARPTATATLPVDACAGLHLAENLISPFDSPRFDNVAVDGYAIRHADLSSGNYQLPLMNTSARAGDTHVKPLLAGYCMRVSTGARMPIEADTIVMQEDITLMPATNQNEATTVLAFPKDIKRGINWRKQGEDVRQGDTIITQGQRLRPQDIGLAVASGFAQLHVHKPPKVALYSTGNEVNEPGAPLPKNSIYDVNRPMLKALYTQMGCQVTDLGILADNYDTIHQALEQAAQTHDLIVTSGGASTGDHDHIAKVLAHLGQVKAWRIAIKPGRPLAFGAIGQALFLGLPGNPVAANVCSLMFGGPLVRHMAGGSWQHPQGFPQTLGFDLKKRLGRREWLRVRREYLPNGEVVLQRAASHGSGILTSMTKADGLVEVEESVAFLPKGSIVDFLPFGL